MEFIKQLIDLGFEELGAEDKENPTDFTKGWYSLGSVKKTATFQKGSQKVVFHLVSNGGSDPLRQIVVTNDGKEVFKSVNGGLPSWLFFKMLSMEEDLIAAGEIEPIGKLPGKLTDNLQTLDMEPAGTPRPKKAGKKRNP